MKEDGSTDANRYVNVNGTLPMTGALNMGGQAINNSGIMSAVGFVKNGGLGSEFLKANGGSDARIMSNLQVVQSSFQVPVNGITTETNLTANPDAGSYTWTDMAVGYSRKYTFYALSTRGTGNTTYTMRFKSNLGTMMTWVLPNVAANVNNQVIEISVVATRRTPTALSFYGKWDSSDTGTTQGFWLNSGSNTNVPA